MASKTAERPGAAPAETPTARLARLRARVAELEAESGAVAKRLADASAAGDAEGVTLALAHRQIIPALLARVRREAAEVEIEILDGQRRETLAEEARVRQDCEAADKARQEALAAYHESEKAYRIAQAGFAPIQARRENITRRSGELRRIIAGLDAPDLPPAA